MLHLLTAAYGTNQPIQNVRCTAVFGGNPDNKGEDRRSRFATNDLRRLRRSRENSVNSKPVLVRVVINRPVVSAFRQTGHRADIAE